MRVPRLRPPFLALGLLAVAVGLQLLLEPARLLPPLVGRIGIVVLVLGMILIAWALHVFRSSATTHDPFGTPASLVVRGPYRFTRNPMYVGVTLVLLSIALELGTWPFLAVPAFFVVLIQRFYVAKEEAKLEQLFGDSFRAYKQRVRRWL